MNAGVAAITYLSRGWSAVGAHAAARNTARFSALWFILAFAAPKLGQWIRNLPSDARLVQSFFAAHVVHFTAVALLLWRFETAHIDQNPVRSALVIGIGFGIVTVAGLTANPRNSRAYTVIHNVALYLVGLLFFLAFAHNRVLPLRLMAAGVLIALVLRLSSYRAAQALAAQRGGS
jgi:hypothetical protein